MEHTSSTEAFEQNPFDLSGKKLTIHLDKLNNELEKYDLRVDTLDHVVLDSELSALNAGDVLKIYCTKISPDEGWNAKAEKWFFEDVKELEDKFEGLPEIVSSAELDRGDMVLTIYLNVKGVDLDKKFESGGPIQNDDAEINQMVDLQLQNRPEEILRLVGMAEGGNMEEAKSKAISLYKSQKPAPVMVFIQGKTMDVGSGANLQNVFLSSILHSKFVDYANEHLRGADNPAFANEYATNKSILAVDMIMGMAKQKSAPIFHVTGDIIEEVVNKLVK